MGVTTTGLLESAREPTRRLLFQVGAHALSIDVQDRAAAEMLELVYGPMLARAPKSSACTAAIRLLGDGRRHVRFGKQAVPFAPGAFAQAALYQTARELFARCAAAQEGSTAFYGALVACEGEGVLLLGPSAIGKSLFAIELARAGAQFLGDETAILNHRSAEIAASPRRPSLRESALEHLPLQFRDAMLAQRSFQTPGGRFFFAIEPSALGGIEPCARAVRLRKVCLIGGRADRFSMRPIRSGDALPAIAARAYARPAELAQLAALQRALRHAACYEVTLGAPRDSAAEFFDGAARCA